MHKQENHDATLNARPDVQRAMEHVHARRTGVIYPRKF